MEQKNINDLPVEVLGKILGYAVTSTDDYGKYSKLSSKFSKAMKDHCIYKHIVVCKLLWSEKQIEGFIEVLKTYDRTVKKLVIKNDISAITCKRLLEAIEDSNLLWLEVTSRFEDYGWDHVFQIMNRGFTKLHTLKLNVHRDTPLREDCFKEMLKVFRSFGVQRHFVQAVYFNKLQFTLKCEDRSAITTGAGSTTTVESPYETSEPRIMKKLDVIIEIKETRKDVLNFHPTGALTNKSLLPRNIRENDHMTQYARRLKTNFYSLTSMNLKFQKNDPSHVKLFERVIGKCPGIEQLRIPTTLNGSIEFIPMYLIQRLVHNLRNLKDIQTQRSNMETVGMLEDILGMEGNSLLTFGCKLVVELENAGKIFAIEIDTTRSIQKQKRNAD